MYTSNNSPSRQDIRVISTPQSAQQSQSRYQLLKNSSIKEPNDHMDYYRIRCADLESYVRQLRDELDITIERLATSGELDEKVKLVLLDNQSLSNELDRTLKQLSQKKSESDLWKQKFEHQLSQGVQLKANYDVDIRALQQDIAVLEENIARLESQKLRDLENARHQFSIIQDQYRTSNYQQTEVLESQVRKLRILAEERERELCENQGRLERLKSEYDAESVRLIRECDHLRSKLAQREADHQIELTQLRQKSEALNASGLANLRAQSQTQGNFLENELDKLKDLLGIKNVEIDTLLAQNQKHRNNHEEELQSLRVQIEILKEKMLENEQSFENQLHNVQERLHGEYGEQIDDLSQKFIKEQNNQTEIHQNQINYFNRQLSEQQDSNSQYVGQLIQQYQNQLDQLNNQIENQKQLIQHLQEEVNSQSKIISLKSQQFDSALNSFANLKNKLTEDYSKLRQDSTLQDKLSIQLEKDSQRKINQLQKMINELQQEIQTLTLRKDYQIEEIQNKLIDCVKELETKTLQLEQSESRWISEQRHNAKLREEIARQQKNHESLSLEYSRKLQQIQRDNAQQLEDSLDKQAQMLQEELKSIYGELAESKMKLETKEKELEEIHIRYLTLEQQIIDLQTGDADFEEVLAKVSGETKMTKSMYEGFMKLSQHSAMRLSQASAVSHTTELKRSQIQEITRMNRENQ